MTGQELLAQVLIGLTSADDPKWPKVHYYKCPAQKGQPCECHQRGRLDREGTLAALGGCVLLTADEAEGVRTLLYRARAEGRLVKFSREVEAALALLGGEKP